MEITPLGTFIKEARIAKGLSQQALSDASGVTQSHISCIENGKYTPILLTLKSLCIPLDIDFNEVSQKYGYNNSSTENISIGTIIRNERIAKGYSLKAFSRVCGISRQDLCDIENNKQNPRLYTLEKIFKHLDSELSEALAKSAHSRKIDTSPEDNILGTSIKEARMALCYSQIDFSIVCGISNSTLYSIENGKTHTPWLSTLKLICSNLNDNLSEVLRKAGYTEKQISEIYS